ncbi:hypothetical protein DFO47_108166 [Arthrobacter sp. AG258]|nr:hypothetical protein DFO47_108166 [Arthrobacter sp. AG258]
MRGRGSQTDRPRTFKVACLGLGGRPGGAAPPLYAFLTRTSGPHPVTRTHEPDPRRVVSSPRGRAALSPVHRVNDRTALQRIGSMPSLRALWFVVVGSQFSAHALTRQSSRRGYSLVTSHCSRTAAEVDLVWERVDVSRETKARSDIPFDLMGGVGACRCLHPTGIGSWLVQDLPAGHRWIGRERCDMKTPPLTRAAFLRLLTRNSVRPHGLRLGQFNFEDTLDLESTPDPSSPLGQFAATSPRALSWQPIRSLAIPP